MAGKILLQEQRVYMKILLKFLYYQWNFPSSVLNYLSKQRKYNNILDILNIL